MRTEPCLGKRELVFVLIVHLCVSYSYVNLCHFFSSSWCQGLAATSACGSSWTFLFIYVWLLILHHFLVTMQFDEKFLLILSQKAKITKCLLNVSRTQFSMRFCCT